MESAAKSFATLFRNSRFVEMGDFRNRIMKGVVFHKTNSDLYIDVGLKFHAVVKKPRKDPHLYVRGAVVSVKHLDYEINDRFIGTKEDVSLLESEVVLLGLISSPLLKNSPLTVQPNQPDSEQLQKSASPPKPVDASKVADNNSLAPQGELGKS